LPFSSRCYWLFSRQNGVQIATRATERWGQERSSLEEEMSPSTFRLSTIIFLTLLGSARMAAGDPVRITFDDLPQGRPGVDFTPLGLQLISFTAGGPFGFGTTTSFDVEPSLVATTPPNVAFADSVRIPYLQGTFSAPAPVFRTTPLLSAWTDQLSFSVISSGTWRAAIYDDRFHVLDERIGTGSGQVAFSRGTTDIRNFRLFTTTPEQRVGIDTLEFNSPVVPEPGTLLLFGSGVGYMLRAQLRKARRSKAAPDLS
jgi:hypothetical protein